MKGLRWRFFVVLGSVLLSFYLLTPSVLKYFFQKERSVPAKQSDPWYFNVLPKEVLKLGLDLLGGVHLVLGIDFDEVYKDATLKLRTNLKEFAERNKLEGVTFELDKDNTVSVSYEKEELWTKFEKEMSKEFGSYVDFVDIKDKKARLKMSTLYLAEVKSRALDQSLETLRNRIDEFGISEPIIQRQGDEKILIQFPGVSEIGRLKDIIARTAKLSFQVVVSGPEGSEEGAPTTEDLAKWRDAFIKEKNISGPVTKQLESFNAYIKDKTPKETEVVFSKKLNINTQEAEYIPYLLKLEKIATGDDLEDAYYGYSEEQEPIVLFQLNPSGAQRFEKGTGENIGKQMAIILDQNVYSAPYIRSKIGARGQIELGRGRSIDETLKEAKDIALVLRSGALPARLEFLEERTIGPSLGLDSIKQGTVSLAFGLALLFIFMGIYYRGSGVVAIGALVLNGIFILAAMAAFEGTLTLPGLAGITLTLGMAVDANVLIFEHMREELRNGKTAAMSIAEGYRRAFAAIFDSNLTTILSGLVLLGFGYGPIRGFSVTMLIGIVVSMFTAVFVTRVAMDFFVVSKNKQSISI